MPTIGSSATITGEGRSTEERARRLYTEMIAEIHAKGIKQRATIHGTGYLWNGNLATIAAKCWPDLTITPGRTGPASKQFLEVIKQHLRDTKNVVWVQERGQFYVSPEYKEARVTKKKSPGVVVDLAVESITDRAKRIWERARKFCEANGYATETYKNVEFWVCDRPLAQFVKAEFPELCLPAMQTQPAFEKYRRPFYDLLRATTNAVNVGSKHFEEMKDGEHHWLIRKEWHDSHEAFENVFPTPEIEEPEVPLVVESVEAEQPDVVANDLVAKEQPLDPHMALARLLEVVNGYQDLETETSMLESEVTRLNAEVARLNTENDALQVSIEEGKSGNTVIVMIEEVLASIYEGSIGMSRAIADVEDIIRTSKSVDGS